MRRWPLVTYAIVAGTGVNLAAYLIVHPLDSPARMTAYLMLAAAGTVAAGYAWRGTR